jgi:SPP1 gp7 family putative phage head morphogenesis protein
LDKEQKEELKVYIALALILSGGIYEIAIKRVKTIYLKQAKDLDKILETVGGKILTSWAEDKLVMSATKGKEALDEVNTLVTKLMAEELKLETTTLTDILGEVASEQYTAQGYSMGLGLKGYKYSDAKLKTIEEIISERVDGMNWINRVNVNKSQLELSLKDEIRKLMKGESTPEKMTRNVKKQFGMSAFDTERLARTETARVQGLANEEFAKETGITSQLFTATLDDRTSKVCQHFDGLEFDIDDPNKPIPPLHPFCRSILSNIPEKGWKPTTRRDNLTNEAVAWQDYEKWKKENGVINIYTDKKRKG